jgi:hypothetical protein
VSILFSSSVVLKGCWCYGVGEDVDTASNSLPLPEYYSVALLRLSRLAYHGVLRPQLTLLSYPTLSNLTTLRVSCDLLHSDPNATRHSYRVGLYRRRHPRNPPQRHEGGLLYQILEYTGL